MDYESDFDAPETFTIATGGRGAIMAETPEIASLRDNWEFERDKEVTGMDAESVAIIFGGDTSIVHQEANGGDNYDPDLDYIEELDF